jgi:MinD-like ATPase involved in chromosome partitioning or flagellar assembly
MSNGHATPDTVRNILTANAQALGLDDAVIHVARGSFGGVRIRIVHDNLAGLSDQDRRGKLLKGIDDTVEVAELITSGEEEWYGPVFTETIEPLPTWAEILEQPTSSSPLIFASDLDQDIEPPAIVTFYSLRGGVGRSTALASAARILAGRGRRVLCIDMDFEAPGLPYLFGLREPELKQGALPLLLALEQEDDVDIRDHVLRASDADELYCLPAGKLSIDYAQRLRLLDPESWYRDEPNPLHRLLDLAATSSISPDIILLDARTGISAISAPLLFDVSDMAVICFFPHPQTMRGTELLVHSMLSTTTRRATQELSITPEIRFLVSPVPPGPSAESVRDRAMLWIDSWLAEMQNRRGSAVGQLQGDELTHLISYSPETAFKDDVSLTEASREVYGPVADWLEQLLPQTTQVPSISTAGKVEVLNELDFSTGTAEAQPSFFTDFVRTRVSVQAMDPKYPLIIGRKGTGKTAIFRWLSEQPSAEIVSLPIMCPTAFRDRVPWVPGSEGFSIAEQRLRATQHSWQTFWACYTALAVALALGLNDQVQPPDAFSADVNRVLAFSSDEIDDLHVINTVTSMLAGQEAGLLASRWLREMDRRINGKRFLLFDGLDTGFGNDAPSRERRTLAVTGLFTFFTENEARLPNLPFKIMLRFDIWQQLRFENKSHLLGRSLQLLWRDRAEYFKTALKQAIRSPAFSHNLNVTQQLDSDVDSWEEQEVYRAWNLLVGERMKGGKTTFTRNWAWNRLADGQGDHGPRALSQLFNAAVDWEKREEERSPYDRSILRPRALVPSLEVVSREALAALAEEFPELSELIGALESISRTPFDPTEVAQIDQRAADELDLALEVGLIDVHEGTHEDVRRYRVPDLYRHALGMSRRGQA